MTVTPNMSLTRWDDPNTLFDYLVLAANIDKLDAHDHSPGKGVPIPTAGFVNGSIAKDRLATTAITDYSYSHSNWQTIFSGGGIASLTSNLVHYLAPGYLQASLNGSSATAVWYFDPAEFAAGTRTTEMRARYSLLSNDTAPGVNFTFTINQASISGGGASLIDATAGSLVSGSSSVFTTPAANSELTQVVSSFTPPAAGWYVVTMTASGTPATNYILLVRADVQIRQV